VQKLTQSLAQFLYNLVRYLQFIMRLKVIVFQPSTRIPTITTQTAKIPRKIWINRSETYNEFRVMHNVLLLCQLQFLEPLNHSGLMCIIYFNIKPRMFPKHCIIIIFCIILRKRRLFLYTSLAFGLCNSVCCDTRASKLSSWNPTGRHWISL